MFQIYEVLDELQILSSKCDFVHQKFPLIYQRHNRTHIIAMFEATISKAMRW